ncbi:TonB-dependent receptor SusC [termite gut metagenome]|uniref:TonB-dependent receptor SusC n=1 Tax=termite gut metagenome TaxID=433724 RepID=A0A5J4R2L5_9ZZZZ
MAKLLKFIHVRTHFLYGICVVLFVGLLSLPVFAQQGRTRIEGRVINEKTNEPIIGANVLLPAEHAGTITNSNGVFTLTAKSLPATIAVNYIGYWTQEVEIYESVEPITITLRENVGLLKEVVVIGYGTQKRKELTGSITSVSKESLSQIATSFDNLLGGAVSGLNITQSSGQPGSTSSIRIRGGNSINGGNEPLYVIDGIIVYNNSSSTSAGISRIDGGLNPLAAINPNDIESIEVLKDVSATAIYGSRGANGVIIVTTKSGKKGNNNIEYQYTAGWQQINKKLDLLSASEWAKLYKEVFPTSPFANSSDSELAQLGEGTDWQDAAFRTASTQNHQITLSGGDEKSRYLISGNFSDQDGIIINTNFKRYTGRLNYDRDLFSNFTVGLNVSASKLDQNGVSDFSGLYVSQVSNSIDLVLRIPQIVPIRNADGSFNYNNPYEQGDLAYEGITVNPISDLYNSVSQTKTNALIGNFYARYAILPSLIAKISVGTNLNNTTQNFFAPPSSAAGFFKNYNGYGSVGNKRTDAWQAEYTLNYNKQINKRHYIDLLAGYTTQTTAVEYATASASSFANEQLSYHNLQGGSGSVSPTSGGSESILNSVLGRVNYSYLGRYNLTATIRADGSSRFARNHKWGYFPSVGLSWNINEESFLRNNKAVSDFKLRASTGTVGNQEIGDYRYEATYSTRRYAFNDIIVIGYARSNAENPDLKWEKTTQHNIGFDLSLFNYRLTFVGDVYYKKTSDLLLNIPVEITTGFSSQLKNIGNVTNKGIEFEVKGNIVDTKNFNWNLSANIAKNNNEITSLGALDHVDQSSRILQVGKPLGSFYALVFDGVVQTGEKANVPVPSWKTNVQPGDVKYADQNNDNKITIDDDRAIVGSVQPDFTYGFSTTLRYKAFSLFASFQGTQGNDVINSLRQSLESPNLSYNLLATLVDRWTPTNPSNTIPKAANTTTIRLDSRYIEDASFLKLRNVTLSYTLPIKIQAAPTTKFRVFAAGQNLLTFTKYSGYDPEISSGTDSGAYPTAKSFSFGVNISY